MRNTIIAALGLFLLFAVHRAHAAGVKVIVHPSNAMSSISKAKVGDLFLKRVTRWENGRTVTPVDQTEKSGTRATFTRDLLGKEVPWVKSYWQKMIFSGRATPPAELTSDAQVIEYVRTNPDSIGYVDDSAAIPAAVKALTVTN